MGRSVEQREGEGAVSQDDAERCSYVHDVSAFEDVTGDRWHCPRSSHGDHEYCRFHLPPGDEGGHEGRAALLDSVGSSELKRSERQEQRRFFGARFGDLDLEHTVVDAPDNYPLDLREARFDTLDLTKAVVELPVWLDRASVDDDVLFHRTRFAEHVRLDGIDCGGDLVCDRATFERNLDAEEATVAGSVKGEGAMFGHYVGFIGSRVEGSFSLHNADVGDDAHLHDIHVCGEADFAGIDVSHRFWCFDSTFGADVEMEKAVVGGPALFDYTGFDGTVSYWNTTFEDRVRWKETVFDDDVIASDLETKSTAKFLRATFHGDVDLARLDAARGLRITEPVADDCRVTLHRATVRGGRLDRSRAGSLVYDFTRAVLGAIALDPGSQTGFGGYHFDRTTFDGFDFPAYHDALDRVGWRILPGAGCESDLDTPMAEETYLKAKNGAKRVGDGTAAAEFFRKEMTYRRYHHADRVKESDAPAWYRTKAAGRWFASAALDLTTGYGERPWRVVGCSVGIIGTFVFVFAATATTAPYDSPLGFLLLSVESFVSLVLGGAATIERPIVRLLAQIEGFLGAFFIALFVFTLTRSVQR